MQATRSLQTIQPQGATRVDWENPITRGLGFVWTASHLHRDIARGASSSPTLTRTIGRYGRSARGGVSNSALFLTPGAPSSSSYTVLAFVIDDGTRSVLRNPFDSDDTSAKRFFQLRFTSSNAPQFIAFAGGSTVATGTAKAAGPRVLVGRTIAQSGLSVWCDGVQDGSFSIAVNFDQLSVANQFTVGVGGGGSNGYDGQILLCAYWARPLSDAEIKAVSANPWQIFAPVQNRALSWPLYVASGGTTISAGPGDASATGPSALVSPTIQAGPGAASAQGVSALLTTALAAGPGSASATAPNALLNAGLIAGSGAAAATGVAASIVASSSSTISTTPAEAAAAGVVAALNVSLIARPGDAAADGPSAGGAATASGAGHSSRRIAISHRGRLHLFESEEEAQAWIDGQQPKQIKALKKIARRVVKRAEGQEVNALGAVSFDAPEVVEGSEELKALANMRAAILQSQFSEAVKRQIARELADKDDEEMAAAVMLLMM